MLENLAALQGRGVGGTFAAGRWLWSWTNPVLGACEDKPVLLHQSCRWAGCVNIRLLTQCSWGVWELGLRGTVRV